jgi:G3E family GTPase
MIRCVGIRDPALDASISGDALPARVEQFRYRGDACKSSHLTDNSVCATNCRSAQRGKMAVTASSHIPVHVLTGFLGSGKTTLLNRLLRDPGLADTAVIVNEFGEIGLDHLLVAGGSDNVVLLDSGCLCCTQLDSLRETLADLYHRRARGELPAFRRVAVETTGLADPAPILLTLLRDPVATAWFGLGRVVATLDAAHGEAALATYPEARAQIAAADLVLLTKTDLTGDSPAPGLAARVARTNAAAIFADATLPTSELRELVFGPPADLAATLSRAERRAKHAHEHSHAIFSFCAEFDRRISWAGLAAWTSLARASFGKRLLRCKGIIWIAETGAPVVVQGVQTLFANPAAIDPAGLPDRRSRLVCIADGIPPETLRQSLTALTLEGGSHAPTSLADLAALPDTLAASIHCTAG